MSATGLDVFDKTLQTTNTWLDEIMADIGPDRQVAWHTLGVVIRAVRDRIPIELSAHLAAQLPLLVRGAYYDQWRPSPEPLKIRSQDEFLAFIADGMGQNRPVNPRDAAQSVFGVLGRHLTRGQCEKVREALPKDLQALWQLDQGDCEAIEERAALGREAQNARDARAWQARPEGQRRQP
jgi:uncharacterized protein (DUF2267 family)